MTIGPKTAAHILALLYMLEERSIKERTLNEKNLKLLCQTIDLLERKNKK